MSLQKENKNYIKNNDVLNGETLQAEAKFSKVTKASEILGYELVSILKISKDDSNDSEVPLWVEQNILKAYKKDYRYRILWRTIKLKAVEYKESLFGTGGGLEIALASMVLLCILGTVIYYQYTKPQSDSSKTIVNKQIPKTEVNPNLTTTPIITPNPVETPIPNIAKKQEKNIDSSNKQINIGIKSQDNQTIVGKKQNNREDSKKIQNQKVENNIDESLIGSNSNYNTSPSIKEASKEDSLRGIVVDVSLLEVKEFYVSSFGNSDEDKLLQMALVEKLKNTDFEVLTTSQALAMNEYAKIIKQGNIIQVVDSSNNSLLWYKSIEGLEGSFQEIASSLIDSLLNDIKNHPNK